MRVLVTGAAGFIGSWLVDALIAMGHEVSAMDNLATGSLDNLVSARFAGLPDERLHLADVADPSAADVVLRRRPEVIVHLAAQPTVASSMRDPLYDARVNVLGMINILDAARRSGCRKVVFASSGGTIYGDVPAAALPIPEATAVAPRSFYGLSKVTGGEYLRLFAAHSRMEYATLALGNVYGPRQDATGEAGVVSIFARRMLAGEPCLIHGDGRTTRDYVYVEDVVDAFLRATTRGTGLINIGTGVETSVLDVHRILANHTGVARPAVHTRAMPGEVRRVSLCPDRALNELGWRPRTGIEQGVRMLLSWLRGVGEENVHVNRSRSHQRRPRHQYLG